MILAVSVELLWNIAYAIGGAFFILIGLIIKTYRENNSKDLKNINKDINKDIKTIVKELTIYIDSKHKETLNKFHNIEKRINKIDGGDDIDSGRLARLDKRLESDRTERDKVSFKIDTLSEDVKDLTSHVTKLNEEVMGLGANISMTFLPRSECDNKNKKLYDVVESLNKTIKELEKTQNQLRIDIALFNKKFINNFKTITD